MAVGLTFVILCGEIDLSVAAIANATGIAVAYFTSQEAYVSIANIPLPGWAAIILALIGAGILGIVNALGLTVIGIPSFIMTLAMMQIAAGVSAMLVRGQIAYAVPDFVSTVGAGNYPWPALDRRAAGDLPPRRPHRADLHALRPLRVHGRAATARRPNIPASTPR